MKKQDVNGSTRGLVTGFFAGVLGSINSVASYLNPANKENVTPIPSGPSPVAGSTKPTVKISLEAAVIDSEAAFKKTVLDNSNFIASITANSPLVRQYAENVYAQALDKMLSLYKDKNLTQHDSELITKIHLNLSLLAEDLQRINVASGKHPEQILGMQVDIALALALDKLQPLVAALPDLVKAQVKTPVKIRDNAAVPKAQKAKSESLKYREALINWRDQEFQRIDEEALGRVANNLKNTTADERQKFNEHIYKEANAQKQDIRSIVSQELKEYYATNTPVLQKINERHQVLLKNKELKKVKLEELKSWKQSVAGLLKQDSPLFAEVNRVYVMAVKGMKEDGSLPKDLHDRLSKAQSECRRLSPKIDATATPKER